MRGVKITKETSIGKCLRDILVDDPGPNPLRRLIWSCDSPRIRVLWEILFDTGMDEVDLLEERIYKYGSMVKEQDLVGREVFLGMITLLEELKKA